MKAPNSQECSYFGRKLSNVSCDNIEVSNGYVCIGSDRDDEIYSTDGKEMLKERVTITAIKDDEDENFITEIDLEEVLQFAAKNCSGIYKRVLKETEANNGNNGSNGESTL